MTEHLYLVAYDIADERRWRSTYRLLLGYGEWLQLSVFQCRMSKLRHAELIRDLSGAISTSEDHVLIIDIGVMDNIEPKVTSLGKRAFAPPQRIPVIV
jgi:CRISPR-associated protein Cas2